MLINTDNILKKKLFQFLKTDFEVIRLIKEPKYLLLRILYKYL